MGTKYKIKKDDLKSFYAMSDQMLQDRYHEYYQKIGLEKGRNGNFHCFNANAHGRGSDNNPSLSVDNKTGQYHCFSCSEAGNWQSYWKNYLKGNPRYGDSYSDFMIDLLGLNVSEFMHFSENFSDKEYEANRDKMMKFAERLQASFETKSGMKYLMTSQLKELLNDDMSIPKSTVDSLVKSLLENEQKCKYLEETRGATREVIERLRIGLDDHGRYTIPIFDAEGCCVNIKRYDPTNTNTLYKWSYWEKGLPVKPLPIDNFTKQRIFIFEGEPDMICAISFGVDGAVTMGAQVIYDVDKVFGPEMAQQIFYNKEIIITLDSDSKPDKTGRTFAQHLAHSLYRYAKQIKIVNLDYDPKINPCGLDPKVVKIVKDRKGNDKEKRSEKDFTDFMHKNGFNKNAIDAFRKLVDLTEVYIENENRTREVICKVTLPEARMAKQYSADGSKILELIASVSDFDPTAYQYPRTFCVACQQMGPDSDSGKVGKMPGMCKRCMLPSYPGFNSSENMIIYFDRNIPDEHKGDLRHIKVSEHNILGLIQVTDAQKRMQHRRLIKINPRCDLVDITDLEYEKLLHVKLVKDVSEYGDPATSAISMEAFMVGDPDIYANKSYKFHSVHTTSWTGQYSVLFSHKAEPIATSIENFSMNDEIHNILLSFRQKPGESIDDYFKRRYTVFGNAAGITGRDDLFMVNDLAFFSAAEIHNKTLLPSISRGYVEALIAGETRCGKTVATRFLHNHYKIGEFVAGSGAVSRSGLLGGVTSFNNTQSISWGKIPTNDGGLITIDELTNVNFEAFDSLTSCRSSGIADVNMVKTGKVPARTRKIMLSNPRGNAAARANHTFGINMLKDICFGKDEILSRFDIATIVMQKDIGYEEFKSSYDQISTEFTEFQCQTHIKWVYSRKPEDIILEPGLEDYITSESGKLLKKFHTSSQLINIEIRAKVLRLAVSVASLVYSIPPNNDWNKIYVIKEHVDFICRFLMRLYCHPNMGLDEYSDIQYRAERLGDMRFMEAILKFVDINQLIREDEFTDSSITQIFYEYLYAVTDSQVYIVSATDDNDKTCAYRYVSDITPKLINLLCSRNCLERMKRRTYRKTDMFSKWLVDKRSENYAGSNYLDIMPDERDSEMDKKISKFRPINKRPGKPEDNNNKKMGTD